MTGNEKQNSFFKKSNKKWKVQDDKYVYLPATSSIDVEDALGKQELLNRVIYYDLQKTLINIIEQSNYDLQKTLNIS